MTPRAVALAAGGAKTRVVRFRNACIVACCALALACGNDETEGPTETAGSATPEKGAGSAAPVASAKHAEHAKPVSSMVVDHGELDTAAPPDSELIVSTVVAATVYAVPNTEGRKLGYVRLGNALKRDPAPAKKGTGGCDAEWYRVYPMGYVCTDVASVDMKNPIVRATYQKTEPDLSQPLPYAYGFVRATAPQYLRVPTKAQQIDSEFKLEEHIQWFAEHWQEVQRVDIGSNDVPLDERGIARPGLDHPKGFRLASEQSLNELFGGETPNDPIPWWLKDNDRLIPNVSAFRVPEYAVFADRVRRKTGLSFVGAFDTKSDDLERRFAVTVDLRLIPTTKVKPDTGSPFHGLELNDELEPPFAFVIRREAKAYKLIRGKDEVSPLFDVPHRAVVPISGKARIKAGHRYYQTRRDAKTWLKARDLGIVASPPEWPEAAEKGEKWIDVSLTQQTLVLYEGKRPWYATLVSTGRDRLGDPEKSLATPRGTFRLQSKHIAAAMDSEENSTVAGGRKSRAYQQRLSAKDKATVERLLKAEKEGTKLSDMDERRLKNIKRGRHPEYGVTIRRGSSNFELRDVPWIQYFAAGYALHGAYWHNVFGHPRSHGCINLAPIDARVVFLWTDPPVPPGWHGINVGKDMGEGTTVHVRE